MPYALSTASLHPECRGGEPRYRRHKHRAVYLREIHSTDEEQHGGCDRPRERKQGNTLGKELPTAALGVLSHGAPRVRAPMGTGTRVCSSRLKTMYSDAARNHPGRLTK